MTHPPQPVGDASLSRCQMLDCGGVNEHLVLPFVAADPERDTVKPFALDSRCFTGRTRQSLCVVPPPVLMLSHGSMLFMGGCYDCEP